MIVIIHVRVTVIIAHATVIMRVLATVIIKGEFVMKFGLDFIMKLKPEAWMYKSGRHELVGPLIESVQELKHKVDKLEQENARLYKNCIAEIHKGNYP